MGGIPEWEGILDPAMLSDRVLAAAHQLADAAKGGRWATVIRLLDGEPLLSVNQWRPGGPSWFTALHQAAWHLAPVSVVAELVRRGALRSLPDARGRTPALIAWKRSADDALLAALTPPPPPLPWSQLAQIDAHLAEVIDAKTLGWQIMDNPRETLRYPPAQIIHELKGQHVWFPVPGMYGGFEIALGEGCFITQSSSRIAEGSGERHIITPEGAKPVRDEFA
jgi:hypothetical protein